MNFLRPIKRIEQRVTWWRHTMRDRWRLFWSLRAGRVPVVVYSMSRSASTSVFKALHRRSDVLAFKSHALDPKRWRRRLSDPAIKPGTPAVLTYYAHDDRIVRRNIIDRKRPCRFVAMVRDPVATNISTFHYAISNWGDGTYTHTSADATSPILLEKLFFESFPHHIATDWFDDEPKTVLGIDVYATEFDAQRKWQVYRQGPFELLVMRVDLPDADKSRCVRDFLGLEIVEISRTNTAIEQGSYRRMEALKQAVAGQPAYVEAMMESRFAQHFWTNGERWSMKRQWLENSQISKKSAIPKK